MLKRIEEYFKKLKEDLNKLKRNWYIDYKGINEIQYLFNEINEEAYYKSIKTMQSFDGNYI